MAKISYSTLKNLCSVSREEVDESFNLIFNKYRYLVYYVSFEILKNEEDAKDVVNDTFLKMYKHRRKFMSESNLKYFLLVTAKNSSINKLKQVKDHLSYSDDMKGVDDSNNVSLYLEKFKDILDEEEYEYLVLHIIYEFTFREIAKADSKTTSQVSSKYRRGLKKLREYYGGEKDE